MSQSEAVVIPQAPVEEWKLPSKGVVGMACLIIAEAAIFIIFVVAYLYYVGKSLSGPTPKDVLEIPILTSICLLSSSITVHYAVSSLHKGARSATSLWLALTVLLGGIFLVGTGMEWHKLIVDDHLTIRTNLFGTTFYSLVGLHATHVVVGLIMLTLALIFSLNGKMNSMHTEKLEVLSIYWHFVDAVWVIVFLVVYVFGR
ncbi:cytochrome c oxidase subunit 3/cytochrome o ubiquinol oxidase subunit 3 [Granulicella aggregans]|uniref:Cytochrome c oxidase subunit 3/cytochrome o ubiquinol oxidase subunit 3 n=1 Tax=Granulicella aggregans TaxID=474949 RepID=A0A7W7Z9K8_9BACT|nr:heme-copper oxidase subunit III [Granulicella aggregans]MBB5055810.1 cytochrome c oxidase subunit 3/cytochrome o ubiquinol oxidase subunit 3 [Granulicella aggregans]